MDGHYYRLLHAQSFGTPEEAAMPRTLEDTSDEMTEKHPQDQDIQHKPLIELTPNLESKSVSRRLSLLTCILHIIRQSPVIIPVLFGGALGAFVAGATMPLQSYFFSKLVTVF